MSQRRDWTPDEEAHLRALRAGGASWRDCAVALSRPYGSVEKKGVALALPPVSRQGVAQRGGDVFTDLGTTPDPVRLHQALAEAETRRVTKLAETFDWLRPVEVPAPARATVKVAPSQTTLVVGDAHFGWHDEATLTVIGHVLEAIKPHRFVWNGDLFDLHFLSRHPKDKRTSWEPRVEVAAFQHWQRQYQAASGAWGMTWLATNANHDGDDQESRWWRYLNDRCPELLSHPDAMERLAFDTWFYPAWAPIQQVPHVDVQHLRVFHGYRAQRHGGRTAMAHADDWSHDVVTSHTHRAGSGYRRIPATPDRPESVREWHEIGCACKVQASYTSRPFDAVNAFALIHESDGMAQVEVVKVVNGKAIVGSLQQRVAA